MRNNTLGQEHNQEYAPQGLNLQQVPVKMYRSDDRLTVAAPMPGMRPEDITIEVTDQGRLVVRGELRGVLKGVNQLLLDEWSVGGYERELELPSPVDATMANLTYGNGVLVVVLPLSRQTRAAKLTLETVGTDSGRHVGSAGHPIRPVSTEQQRAGLAAERERPTDELQA